MLVMPYVTILERTSLVTVVMMSVVTTSTLEINSNKQKMNRAPLFLPRARSSQVWIPVLWAWLKFYFDSRLAPASVSLPPPPQNSQSINFSRSLSLFLICEPFSFRCSFRGGGRTIRWTSFAKHTFQSDSRHSSRPVQWNYLVLAISLQQSVNWSPPSFHKSQYCRCSIIWTTACCLKMKQWSGSPCKLLRISAASGIFIHLPWNHCFGVNHKQIVIVL